MNYRIVEVGPFAVVGIKNRVDTETAFDRVPRLWSDASERGIFERLWEIRNGDHPLRGFLGVCANGAFGKKETFDYMLAVASDQSPPPEGMAEMAFPKATWAVFEADGHPSGIPDIWKRLYTEWVPVSSYDLADLPAIECYLPQAENKNELWVPVVKK